MKAPSYTILLFSVLFSSLGFSQSYLIEGYTYETGNRGFLNQVEIKVMDAISGQEVGTVYSDQSGTFVIDVPGPSNYKLMVTKSMFEPITLDLKVEEGTFKYFPKFEMQRLPGYRFEITLAEKRQFPGATANAIKGARIEVYNNTTKTPELELVDYEHPEFEVNLLQGNHYTILIRKDGYLAKRLEAYVNVEGCILCFEGVGQVQPGVADNLTDGNQSGVLLANVEMDSLFTGKTIEINDIYYELNKWNITSRAEEELDKVITVLKDNPHVKIELGSHTDARGKSNYNLELSEKRAKSAVKYLASKGGISPERIASKGYGETAIKNRCVDGVDCSEEEHAANRRTELKILNVEKQETFKTLAVMKQEEFMDELLLDIYSEGQIKVVGQDTIVDKTSDLEKEEVVKEVKKAVPLFGDQKVNTQEPKRDETKGDPVEIPINQMTANGYKIVVKESNDPIGADDPLYNRHPNLMEVMQDGVYHYLFGDFTSDQECFSFHKNLKAMYPNSYVVLLKGGEIIK